MDRHFDDKGFNDTAPKMRPSELFQRNCWISFEPVENSIAVLADYIGPHKIMWATDYASGRILPRRAKDDPRSAGTVVRRGEASGDGRRLTRLLRHELS